MSIPATANPEPLGDGTLHGAPPPQNVPVTPTTPETTPQPAPAATTAPEPTPPQDPLELFARHIGQDAFNNMDPDWMREHTAVANGYNMAPEGVAQYLIDQKTLLDQQAPADPAPQKQPEAQAEQDKAIAERDRITDSTRQNYYSAEDYQIRLEIFADKFPNDNPLDFSHEAFHSQTAHDRGFPVGHPAHGKIDSAGALHDYPYRDRHTGEDVVIKIPLNVENHKIGSAAYQEAYNKATKAWAPLDTARFRNRIHENDYLDASNAFNRAWPNPQLNKPARINKYDGVEE